MLSIKRSMIRTSLSCSTIWSRDLGKRTLCALFFPWMNCIHKYIYIHIYSHQHTYKVINMETLVFRQSDVLRLGTVFYLGLSWQSRLVKNIATNKQIISQ